MDAELMEKLGDPIRNYTDLKKFEEQSVPKHVVRKRVHSKAFHDKGDYLRKHHNHLGVKQISDLSGEYACFHLDRWLNLKQVKDFKWPEDAD